MTTTQVIAALTTAVRMDDVVSPLSVATEMLAYADAMEKVASELKVATNRAATLAKKVEACVSGPS